MSSTYSLYPSSVPDTTANRRDRVDEPRTLSQYISPQAPSTSPSPSLNVNTPAESESTLSINYQSSEFSEADDPFFGANFGTVGGASPSFLGEDFFSPGNSHFVNAFAPQTATLPNTQHAPQAPAYVPLSPDKTPSLPTASPNAEGKGSRSTFPNLSDTSIAPRHLTFSNIQTSFVSESSQPSAQLTPRTSNSEQSSDSGLAPAPPVMQAQSPRVTVSHWEEDHEHRSFEMNTGEPSTGNTSAAPVIRDHNGRWLPDGTTGHGGLDPSHRPSVEVASVGEMETQRQLSERNREVDNWIERSASVSSSSKPVPPNQPAVKPDDGDDNIPQRDIALGSETENKPTPGQTYYVETGGGLTAEDVEIMRQNRNWADAPLPFNISQPTSSPYQPQTSQAAIDRYQRMCRDNDSIVSRAATWGTRRRSLPSIIDIDVQAAGNFLKKLSISRGEGRRPSILGGLRGLVRKPSANMGKRGRADNDDASSGGTDTSFDQRDYQAKLAPPSPTPGWNRKNSVPSINTAFVAMGSSVAGIGTTHVRSGSISATPITSPRSPSTLNLSVKKPLMNRLRSKSENQAPGLVDMWKKSGGPPVSNLGNTSKVNADADDDEDDDEDFEDGDMKSESNKLIYDITPNFAGFQQHVLKLNPQLSSMNTYLVDRIAHQQIIRYKSLLNARVKHIQATAGRNCPCGAMCIAQGGSAQPLDSKNEMRGMDPLSAKFDVSDGDVTPLEGAINQESFPQDIPMPPTATLPAEFECQLCFTAKKFQKPSDWTKHVHEDVQPFTCTWERCRDPKIFKRKADWVRHENEGHRHLEWWTCDVEDCRHVCYRRDNFLQHLVREHKFPEPKVKTKAAIKRAGGNDPTWQKVEICHQETRVQPQEEPCRFCGKTFPTWKKLTVHLAKHMEQISLPILKLVAKKELDEDTIISPVQEPPPRQFPATFSTRPSYDPSPIASHSHQQAQMVFPTTPQQGQTPWYPMVPQAYQPSLYNHNPTGFDDLTHGMSQPAMGMRSVGQHPVTGFTTLNNPAYSGLPVTTTPYLTTPTTTYVQAAPTELESFPDLNINALGLQNPGVPVQMGYNGGMVDMHGHEHHAYTPQGSVSPYSHSPHQPQGPFYAPQ